MSPKIKLSIAALALAACVTTSMSAFAEDKPARVRGTLQKMDGNTLTIETKSGKETNVPLKDGETLNFIGGRYDPTFYPIDCVDFIDWSYRPRHRREGA